jgi:hypothetical protein
MRPLTISPTTSARQASACGFVELGRELDDGEVVTVGLEPLDVLPRPDQQQSVAGLLRFVEQTALVGSDAAPPADHGQSESGTEFRFDQRLPYQIGGRRHDDFHHADLLGSIGEISAAERHLFERKLLP